MDQEFLNLKKDDSKKRLLVNISDTSSTPEKNTSKKNKVAETVFKEEQMDLKDIEAECEPHMQQAIFLSSSSSLQEALMSLVNVFNIAVSRCRTLESLRAWANMDERLNQEETFLCKHLMHIISHGFISLNDLKGLVSDAAHKPGYTVVWRQWIEIAEQRLRRKEQQDDHLVDPMT